jgi:hypothetical protein
MSMFAAPPAIGVELFASQEWEWHIRVGFNVFTRVKGRTILKNQQRKQVFEYPGEPCQRLPMSRRPLCFGQGASARRKRGRAVVQTRPRLAMLSFRILICTTWKRKKTRWMGCVASLAVAKLWSHFVCQISHFPRRVKDREHLSIQSTHSINSSLLIALSAAVTLRFRINII